MRYDNLGGIDPGARPQMIEKATGRMGNAQNGLYTVNQLWNINLLYNGDPQQMLSSIPLFKQDMVKKKFREIEGNIRDERKLQARYAPLLPKLERELGGINTFKDPVALK